MGKESSGAKKAKLARMKMNRIWKKHGFTDKPPLAVQKLARELCDRLRIPIVIGKKLSQCVIDFEEGNPVSESDQKRAFRAYKPVVKKSPTKDAKAQFYSSWDWRTLRMEILKEFGAVCMCCGATPKHTDMNGNPVKIVVDHIKPLHHHWGLRLQKTNLQVLCDECNQGKGAWDETDHRPKPVPDEWIIEDEIPEIISDQLKIRH